MSEKKRVLIIDDEAEFIDLFRQRLEHEGYQVLAACDGETGMEMMRKEPVDLVLLDIMMPGMDGFEVARRVKVEKGKVSQLPIVVVTAYGRKFDDEQWQVIGDIPLLRKPFDAKELLQIIREKME